MRAGRNDDGFPAGDLVLRRAASPTRDPVSADELNKLAEAWRPYRAYAAMQLWGKAATAAR